MKEADNKQIIESIWFHFSFQMVLPAIEKIRRYDRVTAVIPLHGTVSKSFWTKGHWSCNLRVDKESAG